MKKKFLVSVWLILALTFSSGHFVHAKTSDSETAWDHYKSEKGTKDKTTHSTTKKEKQTATNEAAAADTDGPSTFATFIKLIFSLAFILGLIYLLYRVVLKRTRTYKNDGAIKNVGGVSVGTNRSVQLIRIGEEILVIGVGDTVGLIKEINDPETVKSLLNDHQDQSDALQKNVSKVVNWAKGRAGSLKPQGSNGSHLSKSFDQQLKQLLKNRTHEVEKRLGKDSQEDARNSN